MSMSPQGLAGGSSQTSNPIAGNQGTGKGSGGLGTPQQANPALSPYIMQLLQARLGPWAQQLSQGLFSGGQGQSFNPQSPGMIAQRQQEAQVQQQIAQRQQQAAMAAAAAASAPTPNKPRIIGTNNSYYNPDDYGR